MLHRDVQIFKKKTIRADEICLRDRPTSRQLENEEGLQRGKFKVEIAENFSEF